MRIVIEEQKKVAYPQAGTNCEKSYHMTSKKNRLTVCRVGVVSV